ncbi:hypothetical protein IKG07_01775 [Candidatus Saccharibacteria bacterium]|nr:hypothetical protein [Candidatus Saccharibacteria bacterium]
MKILVTYKSKTGFTKKYAKWIAEELGCEAKDIKTITPKNVAEYDLIIHGGWIFGGIISGYNKIKSFAPKQLIVFGVGFTPKAKVDLKKMAEENKLGDTSLYYFEGGTNPPKMGLIGRKVVEMVTKEKVAYQDNTDRKATAELLKAIKALK